MTRRPLLYYITDRKAFPGDEAQRRERVLARISQAASAGVDYIQLREKDLPSRELEKLAHEAVSAVRAAQSSKTALLINSRTDVALAAGADGIHLRSDDLFPTEVRHIWQCGSTAFRREDPGQIPTIAVSCHSADEVKSAAEAGANFAVFAPVFEKKDQPGVSPTGLQMLGSACRYEIPVLALGGITLENFKSCLSAGAAGIATIRLFQENDITQIVQALRC